MINFVSSFEKCIVHKGGLHSGMTDQHLLPGDFTSIIKIKILRGSPSAVADFQVAHHLQVIKFKSKVVQSIFIIFTNHLENMQFGKRKLRQ